MTFQIDSLILQKNFRLGEAIRVKGEFDKNNHFHLYLLDKRSSAESWDIFDWTNGNIIHPIKNDSGRITAYRVSIVYRNQTKDGIIDVEDIVTKFPIKEGIPIFVKFHLKVKPLPLFSLSLEKEIKISILSIRERIEGNLWDSFPENIGVVDHINKEKGIVHFIVNQNVHGIIKFSELDGKVEIGSKLSVKLRKLTNDLESYYKVLTFSLTQKEPKDNLLKAYNGMVKLSGTVGFADDIYIESSLIEEYKIKDGHFVHGMAILNYNKKKREWGWKALDIQMNVDL